MTAKQLKEFCSKMGLDYYSVGLSEFNIEDITKEEYKNCDGKWQYPDINVINWTKEQLEYYFREYI